MVLACIKNAACLNIQKHVWDNSLCFTKIKPQIWGSNDITRVDGNRISTVPLSLKLDIHHTLCLIYWYLVFSSPTVHKHEKTLAVNNIDCVFSLCNNTFVFSQQKPEAHSQPWQQTSRPRERMVWCQWRNDRWKRGSALWLGSHQGCRCEMAIDWFPLYLLLPWWTQSQWAKWSLSGTGTLFAAVHQLCCVIFGDRASGLSYLFFLTAVWHHNGWRWRLLVLIYEPIINTLWRP